MRLACHSSTEDTSIIHRDIAMLKNRLTVLIVAASAALSVADQSVTAQQGTATRSALIDWATDGGDAQRTGWVKDEKILNKENVGSLKLMWKLETQNYPRALHSLMPVLVMGQLNTGSG